MFSHDTQIHQRCESSASDTGSTTSRSQTSSATSPGVHLPSTVGSSQQQSYPRPPTADGVVQDREGFSSAFGLMSLDDPESLVRLSEDPPFFDNAIANGSSSHNPSWGDGLTPRANPFDAPPANGKKRAHQQQQQQDTSHGHTGNVPGGTPASLKELKEMWKQYMETPFSGQALAHEHQQQANGTNNGKKRAHQQQQQQDTSHGHAGNVPAGTPESLKELKEMWKQYMETPFSGQALAHEHQQQANGTNNTQPDDMRSYEQAVLARRAPLTLHLAPRRRSHTTSTGPPVTHPSPPPASSTTAPPPGKGNRTSPAGSGSGSDRSMSALTDDRGGSYASVDMDSLRAR